MKHPLWVQILSISRSFWENVANMYVGTPWMVGALTSGKSWIRHCSGTIYTVQRYSHIPLYWVRYRRRSDDSPGID